MKYQIYKIKKCDIKPTHCEVGIVSTHYNINKAFTEMQYLIECHYTGRKLDGKDCGCELEIREEK